MSCSNLDSSEPYYQRRRSSIANNASSSPNPDAQHKPAGLGRSNSVSERGVRTFSAQKEHIPWGLNSNEEQYQTSNNVLYRTQDKISSTPRMREPFLPSGNLSLNLIPTTTYNRRKSQNDGVFNHSLQRKHSVDNGSFFDRIGEKIGTPVKQGRLHVVEPKYREPALNSEYRYFRTCTEPSESDAVRESSQSRVVKQLLDYHSRKNNIISGNYERGSEDDGSISDNQSQFINKLGPGYAHILKRSQPFAGKKLATSPKGEDLKAVVAHSYLKKNTTITIEMTEHEESSKVKIPTIDSRTAEYKRSANALSHRTKLTTNEGRYSREKYEDINSLKPNLTGLKLNLVTTHQMTSSTENSALANEKVVKPFEVRQSRSTAANSALSKMTKPTNSEANTATIPQNRSRSNSIQNATASFSKRDSLNTSKERSIGKEKIVSKNSSVMVAHEKKKPVSGGSYGAPSLKRSNIQKMISAGASGSYNSNKNLQIGQKRL